MPYRSVRCRALLLLICGYHRHLIMRRNLCRFRVPSICCSICGGTCATPALASQLVLQVTLYTPQRRNKYPYKHSNTGSALSSPSRGRNQYRMLQVQPGYAGSPPGSPNSVHSQHGIEAGNVNVSEIGHTLIVRVRRVRGHCRGPRP